MRVTLYVIEYPDGAYCAEYGVFKEGEGFITGFYESRQGDLTSVCRACGGRLPTWCDGNYSASDEMRTFMSHGKLPDDCQGHQATLYLSPVRYGVHK